MFTYLISYSCTYPEERPLFIFTRADEIRLFSSNYFTARVAGYCSLLKQTDPQITRFKTRTNQ